MLPYSIYYRCYVKRIDPKYTWLEIVSTTTQKDTSKIIFSRPSRYWERGLSCQMTCLMKSKKYNICKIFFAASCMKRLGSNVQGTHTYTALNLDFQCLYSLVYPLWSPKVRVRNFPPKHSENVIKLWVHTERV